MKQFLRKWNELASERVKDLEKFKMKKKEMYVVNGNVSHKARFEREIRQIEQAIEFNKEVIQIIKAA
jgi:hypothetical protein